MRERGGGGGENTNFSSRSILIPEDIIVSPFAQNFFMITQISKITKAFAS